MIGKIGRSPIIFVQTVRAVAGQWGPAGTAHPALHGAPRAPRTHRVHHVLALREENYQTKKNKPKLNQTKRHLAQLLRRQHGWTTQVPSCHFVQLFIFYRVKPGGN